MFGVLSLETESLTCITACNHRFMKENLNWMNLCMVALKLFILCVEMSMSCVCGNMKTS